MHAMLYRQWAGTRISFSATCTAASRYISSTPSLAKSLPPRPKPPPDSDIEESYLKGSGPGGQKINKTNSAVQLKHIPTGIVVKSQATRSREQNRKHARELLAKKIDDLQNGDQSRSAIVGQVKKKRAASAAKKSRRKYKQLDQQKGQDGSPEQTPDHSLTEAPSIEQDSGGTINNTSSSINTDTKP